MNAAWFLLAFAAAFGAAAFWRRTRQGHFDPATRIWLRVAIIFLAVSLWLLWRRA